MEGTKIISLEYFAEPTIKLVKDNGETHTGTDYRFVEWDKNNKFKTFHHEPEVNYSVMIDPQRANYTWLTTPITEIESDEVKNGVRCIAFKTKNSNYKLYIGIDGSKID